MALFIGFIVTMVTIMMRQKIDLVHEDYYKREINYEDQLKAQKNYASVRGKIEFQSKEDSLLIHFPAEFQTNTVSIELQRPNDQKSDFTLSTIPLKKVIIPTKSFPKGVFTCTINGQIKGKPYEMSQQVVIQ